MIHRGRQRWPVLLLAVCWGGAEVLGEEHAAAKTSQHPIFFETSPAAAGTTLVAPHAGADSPAAEFTPLTSRQGQPILPASVPKLHLDEANPPTDATRLPPVLVMAPKLKLLEGVKIMSRDEFAAQLRKLYPGASIRGQDPYSIANGLPNYARLQYEDDRRVAQKASLEDLANLLEHTGDHAGGQRLKKEIQDAFGGTYKDASIDAMDKSANGGRR
jgi:hypothetical protein